MLPLSVRRVVSSAPHAGLVSTLAPSQPKAAAVTVQLFSRGLQRRFSSSKPSSSGNGTDGVSPGQSVPASASARGGCKATADKRKRKSKDASDKMASFGKLPSVPSTHHMSQEALGLSSFFSLHRPISITQTMPMSVTDEHFASIFAPRTKSNKMSDTMSTLSSTIDRLDGPMAQMTIGGHHDDGGMGGGMHKLEVRNRDGSESGLYLQVDAMSGDFLPFRPPPLPQPQAADAEGHAAGALAEEEPHHRVYKAMFTIEESTEPDGQIRIVAHSPRIVTEQPQSFLGRMARRQARLHESLRRRDLHAISVKRQRKLRMKKKKYKKLMKRTRNLRRKLDRT
ncbi:DUF1713 domain protein [Drechmeria coniospora]|uniref:Small ribosomal subunit protein mS38 n=1 Tax=Drechmeria coniospora TaxID=98403 RepID=A0A151GC55_DRECN|nr:DUF1713 domain protein [Drechmeria coniospora]KYK54625.1 DUF1713 domain protein [Drechmeria coniospora]ODA76152.1 hypothetical protein RJ55_08435 [Drechmeria coniospora]